MESAMAAATKEKEKEKEKERDKDKEKEREREMEMEAALYTNCLLLGLDASVLGQGGMPRSGLFRHSNPRMGETLLHFLLCALRGPAQSAKDFAGVWPIFDAAQSRDFRKIVQNLINELEAQGALPRSNSRVSSLATCCGQRFVELLWQLSAHALREVHKRNFPSDVAASPLPASLTEIATQSTHAAALLSITKARIAVERKRFLDGAAAAVHRQTLWSSLAHDMTAEYRSLCAEEAYLHQELEKLREARIAQESHSEGLKDHGSNNEPISVTRASSLWNSLLMDTERHEKLSSGPIEDLIAHREHRYRVSGVALRAAIDRGSNMTSHDIMQESQLIEDNSPNEFSDGAMANSTQENSDTNELANMEEARVKNDEKSVKGIPPLDVAEIIRRWTHALQRIHKQAFRLAKSNDGLGPELMKDSLDEQENGHVEALRSTLSEHKQHLANIQTLINQLKEGIPNVQGSIATLREQVSRINPLPPSTSATSVSMKSDKVPVSKEGAKHVSDRAFKMMPSHLDLVAPTPALKLPQLFTLSPVASEKTSNLQRHQESIPCMQSLEMLRGELVNGQSSAGDLLARERNDVEIDSLRQAVYETALSDYDTVVETTPIISADGSEHFFTPLTAENTFARNNIDMRSKNLQSDMHDPRSYQDSLRPNISKGRAGSQIPGSDSLPDVGTKRVGLLSKRNYVGQTNKVLPRSSGVEKWETQAVPENNVGEIVRPFSPPLLTELSSFGETYNDLLGIDELCDTALEGVWFNPEVL